MKTKLILISFALFIVLSPFYNPVNAQDKNDILKNSQKRTEIMKSISGSQKYMTEFMNLMKDNQSGLEMMVGSLMNISKNNNDIGVKIGSMMMNDPKFMNLMMTQMINRASNNESVGKNMFNMIKGHNHLYGMMQNMMNGTHMGTNHMGNNSHQKRNSSRGHMMNQTHGMGNGNSSSGAHRANRLER